MDRDWICVALSAVFVISQGAVFICIMKKVRMEETWDE